jgi:hypothetical protein
MKRKFLKMISLAMTICSVALICGCGKSEPTISPDEENKLKTAITDYCKGKNMGMKIKSIEKVEKAGDKINLTCKMTAEGTSMSPKWTFSLIKKDGKWQVENYSR